MNLVVLAGALLMSTFATAPDFNPYAKPANDFEQHLQDAAFGQPGAQRALEDWLAAHPELSTDQRKEGYGQLCHDYGFLSWNKIRARVCTEYQQLKKADGGDDDEGMALAFADEPPVRAIGSAVVPLKWNDFGSQSTNVTVNRVTSSWFVDTGAEITTVTESLARRMAVRPIGRSIRVGTTTSDVNGRVGIIDRLQIGSAYVENVPVLILPDTQLKVGNVHQIEGIMGLQVMVAFGRVAWLKAGRMLALGDAAPKARTTAPHIYWNEEGMGVPVRTTLGSMGAFLDTGDNSTNWRPAGIRLIDPKLLASAKERTAHVGGAGGVVEEKQRELQSFAFDLGDTPIRIEPVSLVRSDKSGAAQIGMDAVSQFGTFILDFDQMRLDGRIKTAAERKASRKHVLTQADVIPDAKNGPRN